MNLIGCSFSTPCSDSSEGLSVILCQFLFLFIMRFTCTVLGLMVVQGIFQYIVSSRETGYCLNQFVTLQNKNQKPYLLSDYLTNTGNPPGQGPLNVQRADRFYSICSTSLTSKVQVYQNSKVYLQHICTHLITPRKEYAIEKNMPLFIPKCGNC